MAELAIYLAAPLFTAAERAWNTELATAVRAAFPAAQVRVPQEFCACHDGADQVDYGAIFADCCAHLAGSTHVLAVLDGADADSGTSWEIGYAYARGIPVIGLRTDWRPGEDGGANAMLTRSCRALSTSVEDAIAKLGAVIAG